MPLSHSTGTPSPIADSLTRAMSRVDGCATACGNTEAPRAAIPTNNGWMASYLCADCGHAWTTSWKD